MRYLEEGLLGVGDCEGENYLRSPALVGPGGGVPLGFWVSGLLTEGKTLAVTLFLGRAI